MNFPKLLVSATSEADGRGVVLFVDVQEERFRVILPYRIAGVAVTRDTVTFAHIDQDKTLTRVEVFDSKGLVWARPVPNCVDTHSLRLTRNHIVLCSTGTNQVIFLNRYGDEEYRWTPDEEAEPDSWHLNNLVEHQGKLFITCFGRFKRFREWNGAACGKGLLIEIPSGGSIIENLSGPHDPEPFSGGWIVNDMGARQTLFCSTDGDRRPLAQWDHYPRGLAILPDWIVVGLSSDRHPGKKEIADVCQWAHIGVIDRHTLKVAKMFPIPFREIGKVFPAPSPKLVASIEAHGAGSPLPLIRLQEDYNHGQRIGELVALGNLEASPSDDECSNVPIRLKNRSQVVWSSANETPLYVSYQTLDHRGRLLAPGVLKTALPLPAAASSRAESCVDISGAGAQTNKPRACQCSPHSPHTGRRQRRMVGANRALEPG
jgi:hypothetical protein